MEIIKDSNYHLSQTEFKKTSKVASYFDYIYNYPPKIKLKWNSIDDFKTDKPFQHNNRALWSSNLLSAKFLEDWLANSTPGESIFENYPRSKYLDGFLDRVNSSNFFLNNTKKIQTSISNIPVFVVLNGQGEIVLSKPSNVLNSKASNTYINEKLYDLCGAFDPLVEKKSEIGLFFLNHSDAEKYLKEVARSDYEGTQTLGLSISCISLSSAYKITREHHPGIDFRLTPNFNEVKQLLNNIGNSDHIVEKEQQQLRFQPRRVNNFPYLNKLGNFILPRYSFLQRDEYFKGVPIYIVQLSDKPRNFVFEQFFNTLRYFDTTYSRCIKYIDSLSGFGQNWIMQGSIQEVKNSEKLENYIFFEQNQALNFIKKNGQKIARYNGSRTSNFGALIKRPKILIYNLEDFLEDWEDQIVTESAQNNNSVETLFKAKATYFIAPRDNTNRVINFYKNSERNPVKNFVQVLDVKFRVLKRAVGVLFSIT
jgi:hypothetical protein